MGLFDYLFGSGSYRAKEECPNCDCKFEAEVSDRQPIFYCPVCGYRFDYSTAPDAHFCILKDSTVRRYKDFRRVIQDRETEVKLANLTPEVKFPKHLEDKIQWAGTPPDALCFKGIMSEKERKELLRLSQDESYKKAIEALFQRTRSGYLLNKLENELEILIFAMFVTRDKVIDKYYATEGQKRHKEIIGKFHADLLHYAVNQIYLKGRSTKGMEMEYAAEIANQIYLKERSAKREEVHAFIDKFCNVMLPQRYMQYYESSVAYHLKVLKGEVRDLYSYPIRAFLDNLGIQEQEKGFFVFPLFIGIMTDTTAILKTFAKIQKPE